MSEPSIDNPASTEDVEFSATTGGEPVVEPEGTDIGELAAVPEAEQVDTDDPEPNEDADDDLADVAEGEPVDVQAHESD